MYPAACVIYITVSAELLVMPETVVLKGLMLAMLQFILQQHGSALKFLNQRPPSSSSSSSSRISSMRGLPTTCARYAANLNGAPMRGESIREMCRSRWLRVSAEAERPIFAGAGPLEDREEPGPPNGGSRPLACTSGGPFCQCSGARVPCVASCRMEPDASSSSLGGGPTALSSPVPATIANCSLDDTAGRDPCSAPGPVFPCTSAVLLSGPPPF